MGDFGSYLSAFLSNWWWFLTSGPYVADPLLESISDSYHWWKMRHFSQTTWQRVKGILALIGIFFAGFFAWRDEHRALEQTRIQLVKAESNTHISGPSEAEILVRVNKLVEERLRPRALTDTQKKKLVETLREVPLEKMYKLSIQVIAGCSECSGYADDLIAAWKDVAGWSVQGTTNFSLKPRLTGIVVGVDPAECPREEIQLIKKAFIAAEIDGEFVAFNDDDKKTLAVPCTIIVGNKPQP